jgi:hypothetical protein
MAEPSAEPRLDGRLRASWRRSEHYGISVPKPDDRRNRPERQPKQ